MTASTLKNDNKEVTDIHVYMYRLIQIFLYVEKLIDISLYTFQYIRYFKRQVR